MALGDLTSRQAVLDAIAEFRQIGRDAFLEKYGFGRARGYFLVVDGREYDSKAIVGAAHGYQFPADGPLRADTFSGGENRFRLNRKTTATPAQRQAVTARPASPSRSLLQSAEMV